MNIFTRQRWLGGFFFVAASIAAVAAHVHWGGTVQRWDYLTGWALLGVMLLLALYNGRKKLPFLPLGTSESWLQIHIYAGLFTGALFLVHVDFKLPTGWLEGALAALYLLVMLSGIGGLLITRAFPRRLAARGGEAFYEEIPAQRSRLASEAESLALASIPAGQGTVLADFYEQRLRTFFAAPSHFWRHLAESPRALNALLADLNDLRRYLGESERATLARLEELVRQKDGLDYQRALQRALKLWLFVHLPFTYSLLLVTAVHVVAVYAFSGGAK